MRPAAPPGQAPPSRPRVWHATAGRRLADAWTCKAVSSFQGEQRTREGRPVNTPRPNPTHRALQWCAELTGAPSATLSEGKGRLAVRILTLAAFTAACILTSFAPINLTTRKNYPCMYLHSCITVFVVALLQLVFPRTHKWRVTSAALDTHVQCPV